MMESNPPQTIYPAATYGRRLANLLIDLVVLYLFNSLLIYPLTNHFFENYWTGFLVALSFGILYFFIFEALFQRTPGKFITGTKVIMDDGSKPTAGTILKRTLIRYIPFESISVFTSQDPHKRDTWWHDRWVSTRVVRKNALPVPLLINNPQPVAIAPEPAVKQRGLRLLIVAGIILMSFLVATSGFTLLMVTIQYILVKQQYTGILWKDILTLIGWITLTGVGIFGVVKLAQLLRKKA
jgi:uncharacterized RDD family membrane protein YckC